MPAYYLPQNAGDIARKYVKDPNLLSFIDAEVSIGHQLPFLHKPSWLECLHHLVFNIPMRLCTTNSTSSLTTQGAFTHNHHSGVDGCRLLSLVLFVRDKEV